MIGSYRGSSGSDEALKQVVESMVMPRGVNISLGWPVFSRNESRSTLMAYQRIETNYRTGQQARLLGVSSILYDIVFWSENENLVQDLTDHLESGFNNFPLRDAFQSMRDHLNGLGQSGSVPSQADTIMSEVEGLLATGSVDEQETNLARVNQLLSSLTSVAVDADWSAILDRLGTVQARMRDVPPYNFRVLGCRDSTAPEVYQLGLAGRILNVVGEFTAET